ncbi:hypothetical protein AKJ16_DCAP27138 [Drosera capensis]
MACSSDESILETVRWILCVRNDPVDCMINEVNRCWFGLQSLGFDSRYLCSREIGMLKYTLLRNWICCDGLGNGCCSISVKDSKLWMPLWFRSMHNALLPYSWFYRTVFGPETG